MTGINPYKKAEVICAAENVIERIEAARLRAKPKKRSKIISALLPAGPFDDSSPYLHGRQYMMVKKILRAASACEGTLINLSNEEFDSIASEYAPIT